MLFGFVKNPSPIFFPGFFITPQIAAIFAVAALASTPLVPFLVKRIKANFGVPFFRAAFMGLVLFYSILLLASDTYNPFIYFRF